jgi:hypothetical protein
MTIRVPQMPMEPTETAGVAPPQGLLQSGVYRQIEVHKD